MSEDRDPALDPARERADRDRLFPPDAAGDGGRGHRGTPSGDDTDDDRLFPPADGGGGPADSSPPAAGERPADGNAGPDGTDRDHDDAPGDGPSGAAAEPASGGRSKGSNSFLRELPVLLLIAFVLAFVLRTFVVQVFYIPSGSMEPTLQVNDRMVVEKLTYRFREPARGEVAVFEGESLGEIDAEATTGERFVRGLGQFLGLVPASAVTS